MYNPCFECYNRYGKHYTEECDSTCEYAYAVRNLKPSGLEFRNELVRRLNESANRYVGGACNGHEYPEVELLEVDEVYEIIGRVLDGVQEDTGE